ncbi:ABC transporter permease [Halosegnis longus]|uniref:ABC transporter permease n=2 Tax=Halosegnis longus TaxID=2216012 RepID=A0AAJ4RA55_9EURY|nr:ABC transporter permease [Salella cibi]
MGDTPLVATSEYNCRGFGVFIRACRHRTFVQMPSKRLDDAAFANIDWEEEAGGHSLHWPSVGLLAGLVVLAAAAVHKLRVGGTPFGLIGWEPPRIAWLLLLAGLLGLRYGLYPMVRDRDRTLPALKRLFSRPVGALSAGFVLVSLLFALVGPEFISWDYARLAHAHQPPVFTRLHVEDVYAYNCVGELANGYCRGTWQYPLGTNRYGASVVQRLFEGNVVAVKLAVSTTLVMGVVAMVVGTVAGYVGGLTDSVLMSYVDIQQTIPALVIYLVVATLFLGNIGGVEDGKLFSLALVFGLLDWGGIARVVRSDVLTRRSAGYIRAAKAVGATDRHVLRRHVVPNAMPTLVTALTRRIPLLVLIQIALAYLALNSATGGGSLGETLRSSFTDPSGALAWTDLWWLTAIPILFTVVFVLAYSLLGDELRDVLDPKGVSR